MPFVGTGSKRIPYFLKKIQARGWELKGYIIVIYHYMSQHSTAITKIERITPQLQKEILQKNLDERFNYNILIHKDQIDRKKNEVILADLCKNSFKFFCNNFLYIQDPEADKLEDKNIPFLLWDYQEKVAEEIIEAVLKGYDLPIEKSRKLGLTWLVLAICTWGWIFHEWDVLVGSRKFEEVDRRGDMGTLFEKVRYMISRLPSFLFPYKLDHYTNKVGMIVHPGHKASIAGEGNSPDFGRSDRRKVIFMDEFTSWEQTDRSAWQGSSATTRCRIPVSTPNRRGSNCFFFQIVNDCDKNNKPKLRLHWTLHPKFSDGLYFDDLGKPHSPWYNSEIKRAADVESVAQELDIDYDASMAGKVFSEFDYQKQVRDDLEYDETLPLYIGWDFGLDSTAMVFIQLKKNKFFIIDEYVNKSMDIYHYLDVLDSKGYKAAIHYGDPHSGESRHITSGQSPATILRRHGLVFRSQRTRIPNRVAAARNILDKFSVASSCVLTIEMMSSWQMKRPKTGNTRASIPDHSEHSHIGEAFTYFCFNYQERGNKTKFKKKEYATSLSGVI